jgi:hypothetical protein
MMDQRFEYIVDALGMESTGRVTYILNDRGARGWELVGIDAGRYIYKRPLKDR